MGFDARDHELIKKKQSGADGQMGGYGGGGGVLTPAEKHKHMPDRCGAQYPEMFTSSGHHPDLQTQAAVSVG